MTLCVITDYMGDDASIESSILREAGIDSWVSPSKDPQVWLDHARRADAVLTRHADVSREEILQLEKCRVIARYGTGHDNVDIVTAAERGIVVTNVPDFCTDEVADHVFALMLALVRQLRPLTDMTRGSGWQPDPLPPIERLQGKTLALVGCGRIGMAVARRALGFGLEVIGFDPEKNEAADIRMVDSLDELLAAANILSLHAPLTAETRGMIDERCILSMPPGAILINAARGGLVDLEAVTGALEQGHLGGVALDVYPEEPLVPDHPLRRHQRAILTPHVAYYSTTSVAAAKRRAVEHVVTVLNGGTPPHVVLPPGSQPPLEQ